ncbi:MAG TPA: glutamate--tRNA ligase [Saprospiraceae bacterium]|nr:glutamate--tRNA ligase [Saprospiraceae bacterium]
MNNIRVRFAPSPTGALHIGGVRTALYNYLLAKQKGGTFILRIEDTDQTRYVPGAEQYILDALKWCGIEPDEGPGYGGDYGPYRQSERKDHYAAYAQKLIEAGHAYYAFDTPEELQGRRDAAEANGQTFKYDYRIRGEMNNSLTLSEEETKVRLDSGAPYTIRLRVPADEEVQIKDLIRDVVRFQTNELDDKVILKGDGLPTYHLANIVDDHLMEISHVIRGEEWLPSTAHHVLLYRFLGWESEMPEFAHLPLIMKPTGKGKLSKRDGKKLGIPVFPLSWKGATEEESFSGFREFGFLPDAVLNFLAFLGWNPGTEQEMFSLEELVEAFAIENIGKSGARFDFDKAKWFNQQYIIHADNAELAKRVRPIIEAQGHEPSEDYLLAFIDMMKERVVFLNDFWTSGYYFFEDFKEFDEKNIRKKWKEDKREVFDELYEAVAAIDPFDAENIKSKVEHFIKSRELGFGAILPILRIGLTGTMKGPAIFDMMALFGKEEVLRRLKDSYQRFDTYVASL